MTTVTPLASRATSDITVTLPPSDYGIGCPDDLVVAAIVTQLISAGSVAELFGLARYAGERARATTGPHRRYWTAIEDAAHHVAADFFTGDQSDTTVNLVNECDMIAIFWGAARSALMDAREDVA